MSKVFSNSPSSEFDLPDHVHQLSIVLLETWNPPKIWQAWTGRYKTFLFVGKLFLNCINLFLIKSNWSQLKSAWQESRYSKFLACSAHCSTRTSLTTCPTSHKVVLVDCQLVSHNLHGLWHAPPLSPVCFVAFYREKCISQLCISQSLVDYLPALLVWPVSARWWKGSNLFR